VERVERLDVERAGAERVDDRRVDADHRVPLDDARALLDLDEPYAGWGAGQRRAADIR
jgi:hypothetical protein